MEQTRNCGNNGFDMYNIGDRCEYVQYAIEIERTLHNMQKELNTCIDPRKAAMLIMRVATEFYDADWCGILDVDMPLPLKKSLQCLRQKLAVLCLLYAVT